MRKAAHVFGPHSTSSLPCRTPASGPDAQGRCPVTDQGRTAQAVTGPIRLCSPPMNGVLIGSSMDWSVRKSFDSLRVELSEGTLAVHCRLDTRVIPRTPWAARRILDAPGSRCASRARWNRAAGVGPPSRSGAEPAPDIPFPRRWCGSWRSALAGADSTGAVRCASRRDSPTSGSTPPPSCVPPEAEPP